MPTLELDLDWGKPRTQRHQHEPLQLEDELEMAFDQLESGTPIEQPADERAQWANVPRRS